MISPVRQLLILAATAMLPVTGAIGQGADPRIIVLSAPKDPTQAAVLIGRANSDGLTLQLEIEGAEVMWMPMGIPTKWREHKPTKAERYHIEFNATDNTTKTRLPYALVTFSATNTDTKKQVKLVLPPMWGSSGLHYSNNSALVGDGTYAARVTVAVPSFAREMKDKDLWSKPIVSRFHFRLKDGMIIEVSEPIAPS